MSMLSTVLETIGDDVEVTDFYHVPAVNDGAPDHVRLYFDTCDDYFKAVQRLGMRPGYPLMSQDRVQWLMDDGGTDIRTYVVHECGPIMPCWKDRQGSAFKVLMANTTADLRPSSDYSPLIETTFAGEFGDVCARYVINLLESQGVAHEQWRNPSGAWVVVVAPSTLTPALDDIYYRTQSFREFISS